MKKKALSLKFIWRYRLKLLVAGNDLAAEEKKKFSEGSNILWTVGDELWEEAVKECYGEIKMEWKSNTECHLENGEIFKL